METLTTQPKDLMTLEETEEELRQILESEALSHDSSSERAITSALHHLEAGKRVRELLKERAFYCEKGEVYDREGYSLEVDECTAIRDVNYRNAPLYATVDEAIDAALAKMGNTSTEDPQG